MVGSCSRFDADPELARAKVRFESGVTLCGRKLMVVDKNIPTDLLSEVTEKTFPATVRRWVRVPRRFGW